MGTNRPTGLPLPPSDLHRRKLPIKRISGSISRIHLATAAAFYFGRTKSGRFDDPTGKYGVLYAAMQPEAAFAEVFLRNLELMIVAESDLHERVITQINCRDLQCVDLTSAGLRALSCDNRISTETPYRTVGMWSRTLYDHPTRPDGIIYRSRHNPRFHCLALFDRCRKKLSLGAGEPLFSGPRIKWTLQQIAKYKLAIEPMV